MHGDPGFIVVRAAYDFGRGLLHLAHNIFSLSSHQHSCLPITSRQGSLAPQVGAERYNLFTGCPHAKTATLVLRGGSDAFIDEAERSLHDAIMIVRRARKNSRVVAGGGAIDMELSRYICLTRNHQLRG